MKQPRAETEEALERWKVEANAAARFIPLHEIDLLNIQLDNERVRWTMYRGRCLM